LSADITIKISISNTNDYVLKLFHSNKGQTIALVGQSEAEKSYLIARFYDVNEELISIDGTTIQDMNLHISRFVD
jgi:ABC-type multidrug transport system fused ATPase/permease subunit